MQKYPYLRSTNTDYIEELFQRYSANPDSVDESWRYFFDGLELGGSVEPESESSNGHANGHANGSGSPSLSVVPSSPTQIPLDLSAEAKVSDLINSYRNMGRLLAKIDPLTPAPESHPLLSLEHHGLSEKDLDRTFTAGKLIGIGTATLRQILAFLRETYCSTIGVEFFHIGSPEVREWLQTRMERTRNHPPLDSSTKKHLLTRLSESETFENFLHTRYVAQKRFSIEGGEALIPTLDRIFDVGAVGGAQIFVLGMAHRGRLNVLHNIYGKKAEYIFTEFEQAYQADVKMGEGDVKYHMGYSTDINTLSGKQVHISMASNPSHLEFVNPVVEGIVRSKQKDMGDTERAMVVPVLIHGDAAFAGQGIVYETLNLSQLHGYTTGGTIHIVVNNQVGFTTSPVDSRSTVYCTDVAKMLEVPIFHVNGDDPEALWHVATLAMEFRQVFKKDVVIDLVCYRKYGHNEGDEPSFTQPLMYQNIKTHPSPRENYARKLAQENVVTEEESKGIIEKIILSLTEAQSRTRTEKPKPFISAYQSKWKGLKPAGDTDLLQTVSTGIPVERLKNLSQKLTSIPSGFTIHPKLARFLEARHQAVDSGQGLDWGNAESLAYASLLTEGHIVRISGQDVERGTFTHRHAVLNDFKTGAKYTPLSHISPEQKEFLIFNSLLSEAAVLGFEYGWSLDNPSALVIWEAQFGDFVNGAQVIIDQFLSSGESKWQRACGIVLYLPHGYEGQGPEHSSARLERFLQLCGKNNMIVCNFTTPAQLFHALRRQIHWPFRKPMIVMTPKSLLRHPLAVSNLSELGEGGFKEVLDDPRFASGTTSSVRKVILCSGKIYYDLLATVTEQKRFDVALVRIEQLYPWASQKIAAVLGRYPGSEIVWVQEEPRNMGAWSYVFMNWNDGESPFRDQVGGRPIRYVGRDRGAAPAVGSSKIHTEAQQAIVAKALA